MGGNAKTRALRTPRPRKVSHVLVHVLLPVAVGALIYVLWRSESLPVFSWIEAVGLTQAVAAARRSLSGFAPPDLIVYSMPAALWAYALGSALARVWEPSASRRARWCWILVSVGVTMGAEVGQFAGAIPGTFDPLDLAFAGLALALGWRVHVVFRSKEQFGHEAVGIE